MEETETRGLRLPKWAWRDARAMAQRRGIDANDVVAEIVVRELQRAGSGIRQEALL